VKRSLSRSSPAILRRMDHPAEPDAEEIELVPCPLELMGMAKASNHDRRPLGRPPTALARPEAAALGQIDQVF